MPGCAAVGCSNSTEKGFIMKRFPRDPERRKLWAANMHRDNWQPTNYSVLCETHFEADMWEKVRVDGTRKLKYNAIPTIFTFKQPAIHRKAPSKRITVSYAVEEEQISVGCDTDPSSASFDTQSIREEAHIINSSSDEAESVEDETGDSTTSQELVHCFKTELSKLCAKNKKYRNVIRNLKRKICKMKLKRMMNRMKLRKMLN